jgi:asparagine synthase (glutamine-hydrolysing)
MKHRILLTNQRGFKWYTGEGIWCKGFIYDLNEKFYTGGDLVGYFSGTGSYIDFEEKVRYANGCFTVIVQAAGELYAACDCIRSFPVFYRKTDDGFIISDNAYELINNPVKDRLNETGMIEFLATGYVTGNETLVEEICQVQAGEIIHFRQEGLKQKFYFTYRTPFTNDEDYSIIRSDGYQILQRAFRRFVNSLQGRTVIIPLSGGYDSRLIAVMLKNYSCENVICITYGRKNNPEVEISGKVAGILGFKWIYIEYNNALVSGYLHDSGFIEYYPYSANLVSMFFMQEYFAVKYLKDHRLIPPDSIFAPGHSGDFLGGSQLFKHGNLQVLENIWDITNRIYRIKYCHKRPGSKYRDQILRRIQRNIEEKFSDNNDLSYSIHEDWDFKEKLAKFNFNSSAVYTFFGYEFRFPFWDNEIIHFFKMLPLHTKINKFLYDDLLREDFFGPHGLNFRKELQPRESELKMQQTRETIKFFLPEFISRLLMTKEDKIFYREITQMMVNDLSARGRRIKIHGNTYNSLIIQWYLETLKEKLRGRERDQPV